MPRKVAYVYDADVGSFCYGQRHPMKPQRVRMTHELISAYGYLPKMDLYRSTMATKEEITKFHDKEYIEFLSNPRLMNTTATPRGKHFLQRHPLSDIGDCPAFEGVWDFSRRVAGGSLGGARILNKGRADVVLHWAGGLHHARREYAAGFCYVNDIVLAIMELLHHHERVLYLDIDVHHGDGVEEAFLCTDRVLTVSFHQYHRAVGHRDNTFFPGSGGITDIGRGEGTHYSVNVPLRRGIRDEQYLALFEPIMREVVARYSPAAIVMQCGADSLAHDVLGGFNLTSEGHARCVEIMKSFDVPLLLLGGGGYTTRNVSRCWAHETGVALGVTGEKQDLIDMIPPNDYIHYYGPDWALTVEEDSTRLNENTEEELSALLQQCLQQIARVVPLRPSVSTSFCANGDDPGSPPRKVRRVDDLPEDCGSPLEIS